MRHTGGILTALALVALASCVGTDTGTARAPAPEAPPPSAQSQALRTYYARVQNDLLARGLMRTDGGGPDTPFTPDMLARNFERIAFYGTVCNSRTCQKKRIRISHHCEAVLKNICRRHFGNIFLIATH